MKKKKKRQTSDSEDTTAGEGVYRPSERHDYEAVVLSKTHVRNIVQSSIQNIVQSSGVSTVSKTFCQTFADRVHFLGRIIQTQFVHIHFDALHMPKTEWEQRSLAWEKSVTAQSKRINKSTLIHCWEQDNGRSVLAAYNTELLSSECITRVTSAMQEFQDASELRTVNKMRHNRDTIFHGAGNTEQQGLAYLALWQELGHSNKGTSLLSSTTFA